MHRKRTLGEKIKKFLEMPKLKRRDRNQRIAIAGVVLFLLVYLVVLRPMIDFFFPDTRPKPRQSGPARSQPGKGGMQRNR